MNVDIEKSPDGRTRVAVSFQDLYVVRLREYIEAKVVDRLALVMASLIWKQHGDEILKHCDSHAIATMAMAKTQEILANKAKELHRPEIVERTVYRAGPRSIWEFLGF